MLGHFRIPLLLTAVLFLIEVIIRGLAQAGDTDHDFDLFTPLAALIPGQPVDGLEAYAPSCRVLDKPRWLIRAVGVPAIWATSRPFSLPSGGDTSPQLIVR